MCWPRMYETQGLMFLPHKTSGTVIWRARRKKKKIEVQGQPELSLLPSLLPSPPSLSLAWVAETFEVKVYLDCSEFREFKSNLVRICLKIKSKKRAVVECLPNIYPRTNWGAVRKATNPSTGKAKR